MSDRLGDKVRLQHILEAIQSLLKYTNNVDYQSFMQDEMMTDACIRKFEIIGEASSKISNEVREMNFPIEWKKMIAFRNLLIHEYFVVDKNLIWDIIQRDIPELETNISEVINQL